MQAKGMRTKLNIAFEDTFGTNPLGIASEALTMPFNSNGLSANQNKTNPGTITGRRDPVEPIMGNIDVGGQITIPVDGVAFGYWLAALFGAPNSSSTSMGKYKHVFKPSDSQPSLVIEKAFPDINVFNVYNGCKINGLSMSVGGDGELVANLDILGTKETIGSSTVATSATDVKLERFSNFQATLKINDRAVAICTDCNLDIKANLDGDTFTLGSKGFRSSLPEGIFDLTGSMTAFFEDKTFLDYATNNETVSAEVLFENGDYSLSFKYPEIKFSRQSPSIDGPAGIKQNLDFSAFFKEAVDGTSIVVTLVNKQENYTI